MFKINLVPEVQERKLRVKRINTYSVAFAATLIILMVASLIVLATINTIQKVAIKSTEKKTTEVNQELEEYRELEEIVLSLENGLAGVRQIMDGGNNWQELLGHLERSTPGDVKFKTLKVQNNTIEGEMEGKSVESLAKLIDSLKAYQVVTLTGSAGQDERVAVKIDDEVEKYASVKSSGQWKQAVVFDPATAHKILILAGGDEKILEYDPQTKKITSNDNESPVSAEVKNLFTSVETTRYEKQNNVNFDIKITFEGSALW